MIVSAVRLAHTQSADAVPSSTPPTRKTTRETLFSRAFSIAMPIAMASVSSVDPSFRPKLRCCNCQDACPGPHVEKTPTIKVPLDCAQTKPGCFMGARAKGHARLDANHEPILRLF